MKRAAYSAKKVDLYYPARRGAFFEAMPTNNEAFLCAEMARLAYSRSEPNFSFDRDLITRVLGEIGFSVAFFESRGTRNGVGTHCILATSHTRELTIAAFRGRDVGDPTHLLRIAQGLQTPWKAGGRVHAGFARALADVADEVVEAVDNLKYRTLYVGHSLGAALATLLASVRKPDHLYTLGSPRVGNAKFAATCGDVNVTRFVDCCDLVTHLFPANRLACISYIHVGVPYYIDRNRNVWVNPSESFMRVDRYCASAEYIVKYGWIKDNLGLREFADHSPINYADAIKVEASSGHSCLSPSA